MDDATVEDYFSYTPIHGAPETAAVLFFITAIVLFVQLKGASRWLLILPFTSLSESIGYILRSICIKYASLGLFITMTLFLLLPPNALALFNYKVVGQISRSSFDPDKKFWMKPRFVTWFFLGSDIFSFLLQSTGASMMSQDNDAAKIGKWICTVGLAIQLVFLAMFSAVAFVIFRSPLYKVTKGPKDKDERMAKTRIAWTIFTTTGLLYVRSIYRLVEFIDGYGGKVYSAEWAFYVFDFVPIFVMSLIYIISFIGYNFPRYTQIASV
ncbi:hypothetical protein GGI25_004661 [Coemansia spiralis]|uniref:RTA1 like protein n=2 Tax=Coemansia TaxID=4863 RepID=A0A9W8G677_9FUNG|nr:RTA1 like protein-domain-containing protein [Coemansia spiralis]KAJ1989617.1 hypothetical protein EDC05_004583 [Coemansia umbellata]KAJ2620574.1 hypothetical protein GGI26_004863 [Coemansia sp. RSA 1358]KAJ2673606.1 hypothetical protein GGI25_004661 [Coemansia spiralis]